MKKNMAVIATLMVILTSGCISEMKELEDIDFTEASAGKVLYSSGTGAFYFDDMNNEIDGGFANSTYLATQKIDGGEA